MRNSAFSLIELMVVVAIVVLLTAIAVPAYRSYVARAKIGTILAVTQASMDRALAYFSVTGNFPLPDQIGLINFGGGCNGCVSAASYGSPPGLDHVYITDDTFTGGGQYCVWPASGRLFQFDIYFDDTINGTPFAYYFRIANLNGTIKTVCIAGGQDVDVGACLNANSSLQQDLINETCSSPP